MRTKPFQAHTLNEPPSRREEMLAVEAPLHVKVNGIPYTTTVRTPGDDAQLVRGLLFTEGVTGPRTHLALREIEDPETGQVACVEVTVASSEIKKELEGRRSSMGSASCGLCGLREPEEIQLTGPALRKSACQLSLQRVTAMQEAMHAQQAVFAATGGSHAAAAFDDAGILLEVYEDIGRHNAVDKVVGRLLELASLEQAAALLVSGRISYEIVFKAYQAAIPVVIGISAASSLAVEMGDRFGITVAGFCRGDRVTVYTAET